MTEDQSNDDEFSYVGDELELFLHAENWKRYVAARVRPFVQGNVLEVGAGLGANTPFLFREDLPSFRSLEPDPQLCERYRQRQSDGQIASRCELVTGTLETLPSEARFDTLIYLDVLEHIEDDAREFRAATDRLSPGGHLIILCPAHNWLFSPFDRSIGHFRRYNKAMYRELGKQRPVRLEYLDSVGLFASLANRVLLRQSYPGEKQIRMWDRLFVRASRICDPMTFRCFGKSLLGVWRAS